MTRLTPRLAAGIFLVAACLPASAQLQLTCPVHWEQIPNLRGPDVDQLLFGVKVRDWKPEYFDTMARKHEECMAKAKYPESVKQAERADVQRTFSRRGEYFKSRDEAITRGDAAMARQAAEVVRRPVPETPQRSITSSPSIQLQLRFWNPIGPPFLSWDCEQTGTKAAGWLDDESIKKLALYTRICLQSGVVTRWAAKEQLESLQRLMRLYVDVPVFAAHLSAAARSSTSNANTLEEMSLRQTQLVEVGQDLAAWWTDYPLLKQVDLDLQTLRKRIGTNACDAANARANFPETWKTAIILADVNSPEPFPAYMCLMASKGAQVRYLSGGLFSSEGFEVRSTARIIQVYVEVQRVPGGDPNVPYLVPVTAKIDGTKMTITRANYRAFQAELIAAMMNQ